MLLQSNPPTWGCHCFKVLLADTTAKHTQGSGLPLCILFSIRIKTSLSPIKVHGRQVWKPF